MTLALGVTTISIDALPPGATELGTLANASLRTAVGVGVGVSEVELDELFVGVAVVVPPGLLDGDTSAEGDGVSVAARAAAVPLARTIPVPTLMISGVRTDRASTAHDLLNDFVDINPTLRHA
ncbi:hypothetical protein [Actinoallomurus acaciae]|uniref:Uncharacterized protein n=1 Tax=Actinoallomurus acaciae TaxID=502577 RepID=A0ABV5YSY8_9ACTN